jgi:hypothetical protein
MESENYYIRLGLLLLVVVLEGAEQLSCLMPTMRAGPSHVYVVRAVPVMTNATCACLMMVLWSGVGESALPRYTAYTLYIGANALGAFIVLQVSASYNENFGTLRIMIIVDWITLATVDKHWWVLATAPSVNLLLGGWIVVTIATLAAHIRTVYRHNSNIMARLDGIVGAVSWMISVQLQPLSVDQQGYIRCTLLAVLVTVRLQPAWLKLCVMLSSSLYCLLQALWGVWVSDPEQVILVNAD